MTLWLNIKKNMMLGCAKLQHYYILTNINTKNYLNNYFFLKAGIENRKSIVANGSDKNVTLKP